ncbi:MAG: hypothetical protein KDC92_08495 [Bacteroidetes bacterium]|nr:hypothetical protein [Bacteroidota bacterium]
MIFLIIYSGGSVLSDGNLEKETIQCSPSRTITIELSKGYFKKSVTYEEGIIETFTFSDSSYIFIFCGRMQTYPMLSEDKYQVTKTKELNGLKSRLGINLETSKLWREDNYKSGIAIVYDNVPESRQTEFNNMLGSIEIKEQ